MHSLVSSVDFDTNEPRYKTFEALARHQLRGLIGHVSDPLCGTLRAPSCWGGGCFEGKSQRETHHFEARFCDSRFGICEEWVHRTFMRPMPTKWPSCSTLWACQNFIPPPHPPATPRCAKEVCALRDNLWHVLPPPPPPPPPPR